MIFLSEEATITRRFQLIFNEPALWQNPFALVENIKLSYSLAEVILKGDYH